MKRDLSLEKNPEPEESFVSRKSKLFSLFQLIKAALSPTVVSSYHSCWKKTCLCLWAVFYFPGFLSATAEFLCRIFFCRKNIKYLNPLMQRTCTVLVLKHLDPDPCSPPYWCFLDPPQRSIFDSSGVRCFCSADLWVWLQRSEFMSILTARSADSWTSDLRH